MEKRIIRVMFWMIVILLISSCSGSNSNVNYRKTEYTPIYQNNIDLSSALKKAADQAFAKVDNNQPIAIVQLSSSYPILQGFLLEELQHYLVQEGYVVVERELLDIVKKEQDIQMSGEIDDNTAVRFGKFVGASVVVSGGITNVDLMDLEDDQSIKLINKFSRLRLKVIDTETAVIIGTASEIVTTDVQQLSQTSSSPRIEAIVQLADSALITEVKGNNPNPFDTTTSIFFDTHQDQDISLYIFDIKGKRVRILLDQKLEAGSYNVVWDGLDDNGKQLQDGVYFYRMQTEGYRGTKKMLLIKQKTT